MELLAHYHIRILYVDSFERNLDKFWSSQDVYYNYKATVTGTGNRSTVM